MDVIAAQYVLAEAQVGELQLALCASSTMILSNIHYAGWS
jgi:hypothetical protein